MNDQKQKFRRNHKPANFVVQVPHEAGLNQGVWRDVDKIEGVKLTGHPSARACVEALEIAGVAGEYRIIAVKKIIKSAQRPRMTFTEIA